MSRRVLEFELTVIFVSFYDFLLSILAPCTLVAICQPEFITRIHEHTRVSYQPIPRLQQLHLSPLPSIAARRSSVYLMTLTTRLKLDFNRSWKARPN